MKHPLLSEAQSLMERMEGISIINEGIDIDYEHFTVSYNPSHQNNVDTSIENNLTVSTEYGNGIRVYSLLKRKKDTVLDGNPLLYAFKNEKGWKFATEEDKRNILLQIDAIAEKFSMMYQGGFTILIPSGNPLNRMIGEILKKKAQNIIIVDDVLTKITTEEVKDIVMTKNSPFLVYYRNNTEQALRQLRSYLDKMDAERNGYFTRHFVRDSRMRDILTQTLKLSTDAAARYAKDIDGKDILLIDDSISRGQTIKEACNIIQENYEPNSITVLTLFSKAY